MKCVCSVKWAKILLYILSTILNHIFRNLSRKYAYDLGSKSD